MNLKRITGLALAGILSMSMLAACGNSQAASSADSSAPASDVSSAAASDVSSAAASADAAVVQVGFENSISEPFGQGLVKWQQLVDEKSNGTLKIELYPDSQLGSKSELIDSMLLGEPVVTLADGAFYADYGVPDFGIVFGPFLFDDWDQCWKLTESDWYQQQS